MAECYGIVEYGIRHACMHAILIPDCRSSRVRFIRETARAEPPPANPGFSPTCQSNFRPVAEECAWMDAANDSFLIRMEYSINVVDRSLRFGSVIPYCPTAPDVASPSPLSTLIQPRTQLITP